MRRSICNQCKKMSESWTAILVFGIMFGMVLCNFYYNVNQYQGFDVIMMYHPMRLLAMTTESLTGIILVQMLPLLAVFACGFTYIKDRNAGIEIFEISRSGAPVYFFSKIIAVFIVTMCVFTIPLLAEMLLNCVSFPLDATGDLSNMTIYSPSLVAQIKDYMFFDIYKISPYLYAIISIMAFGVWMGILAAFVVAISFLPFVKTRLLLFLPLYFIVSGIQLLGNSGLTQKSTYYGLYLFMYASGELSKMGYVIVLLLIYIILVLLGLRHVGS